MQYSRKCTKSQRKKGEFSEKKIKSVTLSRIVTRARKLQLKLFTGVNEPIYWSFIEGK